MKNEKKDTETLDFNNPSFKFSPNENHQWRQQGYYLICKSCELQHAVYIGPKKLLVGLEEDGTPILKNREDD